MKKWLEIFKLFLHDRSMGKCKCRSRNRIVSNVVQQMESCACGKGDVCNNPECGEPRLLSLYAPVIYDEVGINLCSTLQLTGEELTTFQSFTTATNGTLKVIHVDFTVGEVSTPEDPVVTVRQINGRVNCYEISLTNMIVTFAMNLYDNNCNLLGTIYPSFTFLPADETDPEADEDTNPTSIVLELFAPYGVSYDDVTTTPTPTINYIGYGTENAMVRQGINLYALGKLLDFDIVDGTITAGVTMVLQSLYYGGYKVASQGKIDVPKGSILSPEDSDCMRFVAGDLLDLEIKPLDLGAPCYEENKKIDFTSITAPCGTCNQEDNCPQDAGGNH